VNEDLIELGLNRGASLLYLTDRILSLITDVPTEHDKLQSEGFKKEVRFYQDQIRGNKPIEPIAAKLLDICQEYFHRSRLYRLEREHEFMELIEVLREGVSNLSGRSSTFSAQMATSSERFNKIIEIDDIREIKRQIAREVAELRRVVEEKQKHDEESLTQLSNRVEMLQTKLTRTTDEAATDALTRVANRGSFDKTIERWVTEHSTAGGSFVLALADIDNFKMINDAHGHPIGDRVLVGAAQILSGSLRPADFVARYGGEEFAILLSGMKLAGAEARIGDLLKTIAAHRFEYESGSLQFTLSCGMAEFVKGDTADVLIARADDALYEAKRKGKNRVVTAKKSVLKSLFT